MQRPGFNIACNHGNNARWGFCNNIPEQKCQELDTDDADAAIGIGLIGQSTKVEMGAGWTQYFASNSPDNMKFKKVWISVKREKGNKHYYTIILWHWYLFGQSMKIIPFFYCLTVCPSDWTQFGSDCYRYFNNHMDWNMANDFCKARLGHLLSIHSENEVEFLKGNIIQNATSNIWIGGFKSKWPANNWQWTDGSTYDYFNWFITTPDNFGSPVCILMFRKYGFKWNDGNCKDKFPFICQKKLF